MKKRVLIIPILVMSLLLAGCSKKSEEGSGSINPDDYVKLGDLEGLEVTVEVAGEVTDEQLEQQITSELNYYVEYGNLYDYEEVPDKTVVEEGDMVNIDYEGKEDGTAFAGGTAQGAYLQIGSNSFIEGFESGLIGHSVGEEVDLNLTFPENYQSTEMAGKAVVFHVKINSIHDAEKKFAPEFNDEFIKKLNFGFSSMEEYRADVKSYIEQQIETQNESAIDDAIWEAVYDECEVSEPPKEMVDEVKERVYKNAEDYAAQAGVEFSEFVSSNMNMTEEQFETEAQNVSVESAKNKLIMRAIGKQQEIEISKKYMDEEAEKEYAQYGYENAEAYIQAIGGEDTYKDYLLSLKVNEYLKTIVEVHKVEKQEETPEDAVSGNSAAEDNEAQEAVSENTAE